MGADHPNFKHGRASRYTNLPTNLKGSFDAAVNDPDLLTLQSEIALIDVRLGELVGRVESSEASQRWLKAQDSFKVFMRGRSSRDVRLMQEGLEGLEEAIGDGVKDAEVWQEITSLIDMRRKLVESEQNRRLKLGQLLTMQQVLHLLGEVGQLISENVTDPSALKAIDSGLHKILEG